MMIDMQLILLCNFSIYGHITILYEEYFTKLLTFKIMIYNHFYNILLKIYYIFPTSGKTLW